MSDARSRAWSAVARRIRVPAGFVFAIFYLWFARPTWQTLCIGFAPVIAGLALRGVASGHLEKNLRLTTSGPYAYTRNPLYLGSFVLSAGFLIAARSWLIAGFAAAIFVLIYLPVIRAEETLLEARFPEFTAYAARVPLLIPSFSRYPSSSGGFSWQLYLKHREYNAVAGTAALLAALAIKIIYCFHSLR